MCRILFCLIFVTFNSIGCFTSKLIIASKYSDLDLSEEYYIFNIDGTHREKLDASPLTMEESLEVVSIEQEEDKLSLAGIELAQVFKERNLHLGEDAIIRVIEKGKSWGLYSEGNSYFLRCKYNSDKNCNEIKVYWMAYKRYLHWWAYPVLPITVPVTFTIDVITFPIQILTDDVMLVMPPAK